jgi:hypothetical protein
VRRSLGTLAAWAVLGLLPARAFALCPNCLGQTRTLTPTLRLLGAFLLIPFVLVYVAWRVIRRACRSPSRSG